MIKEKTLDKKEYRRLFPELDVSLHMSPTWMDAVCLKGGWDIVSSYSKSGKLQGLLVYHWRKVFGFRFILMPPMCFYNGIKLFYPEKIKNHSKASFEEKTINDLIHKLPHYSFYYQQYDPAFTNWAPLYWNDFNQSTRYTYRIDTQIDKTKLEHELKGNVRRNIAKAKVHCRIEADVSFKKFSDALISCYTKRKCPFDLRLIESLCSAFENSDALKMYLCKGKNDQQIHAGILIAEDKNASYYVAGFYNPEVKELGGLSFLLWNQIIESSVQTFDFEGSMIKDIEYFFRGFGGKWIPHFRIWKINSLLLAPLFKIKFRSLLHS